jgi:hypothetical protein
MSWSSFTIVVLFGLLVTSLYYLIKFALIILKIEDAVEETLDILDERYRSISKILEIPLFYDSPQIRQVIQDVKSTRDSLLLIANRFASIDTRSIEDVDMRGEDSPQDD